jgi:glycosyltransferase involved in cell wall biosynthesis
MKLISIVVPIASYSTKYGNLLEWISKCKDERIEILICYDQHGKQDSNFIAEFAKIQSGISRVIKGPYLSPGMARNAGLEQACGKWVIFCDSDDFVNVTQWDLFISILDNYSDSTLVAFNFSVTDSVIEIRQPKFSKYLKFMAFINFSTIPGLWRLCFDRESIGSTRFTNIRLGEDILFLIEFLSKKREISYSNFNFYTYFVGQDNQLTQNSSRETEYVKILERIIDQDLRHNMQSRIFQQIFLLRIGKSARNQQSESKLNANKYRRFITQEISLRPFSSVLSLIALVIFGRKLKPLLSR